MFSPPQQAPARLPAGGGKRRLAHPCPTTGTRRLAPLTRVQLLGGRAELGIFRDPVSNIRAFGRSPRCAKACRLGYSVGQVLKI